MWLAIVVLIIFCIDKSRQNKRTRWALYNCVYPLYGSAVFKAIQLMELLFPFGWRRGMACLAVAVVGAILYPLLFKPQTDIPYNRLFRMVGWGVVIAAIVMEVVVMIFLVRAE